MMNIGKLSAKQSQNNLIYFLIINTLVGLFGSAYLLINLVTGLGQTCNPLQACYLNAESYSTIFSSEIMVFPTFYFCILLFLTLYFFSTNNKTVAKLLYYLSECALLIIALFVYMQIYRSQGICSICILICISAVSIFLSSFLLPRHFRQL